MILAAFERTFRIIYGQDVRRSDDYKAIKSEVAIIDEVSISINGLRNGIAHSRLDMEHEARHLTDIKFVEEMLYVIRLKKMGVEDTIIQKSINELFKENIVI